MSALRVLFIGGSGVISSACSWLAAERGIELSVLNRGSTALRPLPAGATVLHEDPSRQPADPHIDAMMDKLIETYRP